MISRAANGSFDSQIGLQNSPWPSPKAHDQKTHRGTLDTHSALVLPHSHQAHMWVKIRVLDLTTSMLQATYISLWPHYSSTVFHVDTMGKIPYYSKDKIGRVLSITDKHASIWPPKTAFAQMSAVQIMAGVVTGGVVAIAIRFFFP